MIKTDKIRKPQPVLFYIIDYLWSGFTGLSVAMMVVALWAWGSAIFGEFMLPAPADVFQKALDLLEHFQQNEIDISLWRSVVGITIALVAGLAVVCQQQYSALANMKSYFSGYLFLLVSTLPEIHEPDLHSWLQ